MPVRKGTGRFIYQIPSSFSFFLSSFLVAETAAEEAAVFAYPQGGLLMRTWCRYFRSFPAPPGNVTCSRFFACPQGGLLMRTWCGYFRSFHAPPGNVTRSRSFYINIVICRVQIYLHRAAASTEFLTKHFIYDTARGGYIRPLQNKLA